MYESDGISEVFGSALRTGLAVAGQLVEVQARMREQQAREARLLREKETQERLQEARSKLRDVSRPQWWEKATPDQIAGAWEAALASQKIDGLDAEATKAADRIRVEVKRRYGIDADNTGVDPASVQDAVARRRDELKRPPAQMKERQEAVLKRALEEDWFDRSRGDYRLMAWDIAQRFAGDELADEVSRRIYKVAAERAGGRITQAFDKDKAVRAYLRSLMQRDPAARSAARARGVAGRGFPRPASAAVKSRGSTAAPPRRGGPSSQRGRPAVERVEPGR